MNLSHTLVVALIGTALVGIACSILGVFAVLRKQSLLGEALAHATLPGVAIAFLITLEKDPLTILLGAFVAGIAGYGVVNLITHHTRLHADAALGIVLSVFFGAGVYLLSIIQRLPVANKAGLDDFLFGNASAMLTGDVRILGSIVLVVVIVVSLFYKEFEIITFDPLYAKSIGYPVAFIKSLMSLLLVVAIVVGLQTVGAVLISAFIIAPAIAARQWTHNLFSVLLLAVIFGVFSSSLGSVISSSMTQIPTGPIIVTIVSLIGFASIFLTSSFSKRLFLSMFGNGAKAMSRTTQRANHANKAGTNGGGNA